MTQNICYCVIFILQAESLGRSKLCVAMVTMWPKRQQTKIKLWTKNEFITISFGQSFWNFVGVKGISSGRLYQKIRAGYKFSLNRVNENCLES